jgi:hypothetical protein
VGRGGGKEKMHINHMYKKNKKNHIYQRCNKTLKRNKKKRRVKKKNKKKQQN